MNSLEAKVVILGAQGTTMILPSMCMHAGVQRCKVQRLMVGAGKTSLVVRFVENNFHRNLQSTIGASFLVKKVYPAPIHPPSRLKYVGVDLL